MKVAGVTFQKISGMFSWSITFKEAVSDLIFLTAKHGLHIFLKFFQWLLKICKDPFKLFPSCPETSCLEVSSHFLPLDLSFLGPRSRYTIIVLEAVRKKRVLLLLYRFWAKRITYLGNHKSVEKFCLAVLAAFLSPWSPWKYQLW